MFEGIIEQRRVVKTLTGAVCHDAVSHAYLFTGPAGCGKRAMARAFAQAILCSAPVVARPCGECQACMEMASGTMRDFIHLRPEDGQRTIKIRQVRELIGRIASKTYDGNTRVCLITGAETMTPEAQNALLKSLEEPEAGNVFLMTTENVEKILPTIRSRCQVMPMEPLSDDGIRALLHQKGLSDGQQLERIVAECGGIPGRAIGRIENNGIESIKNEAFTVIYAILNHNAMPIFALSEGVGKSREDSAEVLDFLITGFESLYRVECGGIASERRTPWITKVFPKMRSGQAQLVLDILFALSENMQYNINLRLQWESTLLKLYDILGENR